MLLLMGSTSEYAWCCADCMKNESKHTVPGVSDATKGVCGRGRERGEQATSETREGYLGEYVEVALRDGETKGVSGERERERERAGRAGDQYLGEYVEVALRDGGAHGEHQPVHLHGMCTRGGSNRVRWGSR